ncbi:MAG: hypothetical protein HUU55_24045 [Myxococcales bacterium]|nr:hypothetical protein [Myxococcales bacterium]
MARRPEIVTADDSRWMGHGRRRNDLAGFRKPTRVLPSEFELAASGGFGTTQDAFDIYPIEPRPTLPACAHPANMWLCPNQITTFLDTVGVIFKHASPFVDPPSGSFFSGVLVGPRHVLTSASSLTWLTDDPYNPTILATTEMSFAPSYCWGNSPYGQATITDVVHWKGAVTPTAAPVTSNGATWTPWPGFDCVVCILSKKINIPNQTNSGFNKGNLPIGLATADITKQLVSQIGYPALYPYPPKPTKQGTTSVFSAKSPQGWGPEALYLLKGKLSIVFAQSVEKSWFEDIYITGAAGKATKVSKVKTKKLPVLLTTDQNFNPTGGYAGILYMTTLYNHVGMDGGPVIAYGVGQKPKILGTIRRSGQKQDCTTTFAGGEAMTKLVENALLLFP